MSDDLHALRTLDRIERELVEIRKNTSQSWRSILFFALLRGAGFVAGTVVGLALLGWILSALGVIPGLGQITAQLRQITHAQTATH